MNQVVLEDRFTNHQKLIILVAIGLPFLLGIYELGGMALNSNLNINGYLVLVILIFIYSGLIIIAFLKRGFVKINSELYTGSFFREKLILKKRVDLSNTPKVAILKFKKAQKLAWVSIANPDLATEFNAFEINFLNDRHTKRKPILTLKKEANIEPTIKFLTENFDLENEAYSPRFK